MKPPVQTNEIFYGGTGCLFLSSSSAIVLYELQQQKVLAEVASPPVKYVVWSNDGNMVALLSKHSKCALHSRIPSIDYAAAITIVNKTLSQSCLIHETIRIKSGAWDDSGAFVYSTLNHIKFCLPNGYDSYTILAARG